jgi:hypothetical protein
MSSLETTNLMTMPETTSLMSSLGTTNLMTTPGMIVRREDRTGTRPDGRLSA